MDLDLLKGQGKYIIKKYEDRQMYDLQLSEKVNLNQLETLVKDKKDLIIIDKEDQDITVEILADSLAKGLRRVKSFGKLSTTRSNIVKDFLSTLIKEYL